MKKICRFWWIIAFPLASILVGAILMTLVYAIPTERMERNVRESTEIYMNEEATESWAPGIVGATLDNLTDATIIMEAIYSGDESALEKAMSNPSLYLTGDEDSFYSLGHLRAYLSGENPDLFSKNTYARYWHGNLLTFKLGLLFFNISELRILNMIIQGLLSLAIAALLFRRFGLGHCLAFGAALMFLNPITCAMNFQNAATYYILLVGMLVMLLLENHLKKNFLFAKLLMFTGIATAFFDFLTYPLVPLGMMLVLYLTMNRDSSVTFGRRLLSIIGGCTSWAAGYLIMWAGKWVLSSIVTGENVLSDAASNVALRTGTSDAAADIGLFSAISKNISEVSLKFIVILAIAAIIYIVITCIKKKGSIQFNLGLILSILVTALLPFAWYIVTRNHSYIHTLFTYRELAITLFGILIAVASVFSCPKTCPGVTKS